MSATNSINVSVNRKAKISLSAAGDKDMELSGGGTKDHSKLKNLGFDESGHTGFQKELTKEQLDAIGAVGNKEDMENKVTELSKSSTHEQYPSAKAVYDALEKQGDFELIESVALEENVTTITHNFDNTYKELYMRFVIPSAYDATNTEKARFKVYTLNDSGGTVNKSIYDQGNYFIADYSIAWVAVINIKMFGKHARAQLWFDTKNMFDNAYARGQNSSNYNGFLAPSVQTAREFLPAIRVQFFSQNSIRYLPVGTTYELWGVRK